MKAPDAVPLTKRELIAAMESLPDDADIFTSPHDVLIAVTQVGIVDDSLPFGVICTSEDD